MHVGRDAIEPMENGTSAEAKDASDEVDGRHEGVYQAMHSVAIGKEKENEQRRD
jgi:hypothetical protein